jgi:hypothetical protein
MEIRLRVRAKGASCGEAWRHGWIPIGVPFPFASIGYPRKVSSNVRDEQLDECDASLSFRMQLACSLANIFSTLERSATSETTLESRICSDTV